MGKRQKYIVVLLAFIGGLFLSMPNYAQEKNLNDSIRKENKKLEKQMSKFISEKQFMPDPVRATWMALVIPGGGQIYNRKYWKLPIFYGGFAGCAYALNWNSNMYNDYMNAYKDAMNNKWESKNITNLLPPSYINRVSKGQLTDILKKRKDRFRRYRDMSIFAFIAVYVLSVVDAYVDAELSAFDIGPDISMSVSPTMIKDNPLNKNKNSIGVSCSFRF